MATLVRCIIAFTTELGNDEVYYRLYANPLQWNYFDHPPMVGWLIRLSTFNLLADTAFTIRLGAILCGALATWIMYLCGKRLNGAYAGFLSALLYTSSIYGSIIAGIFILPDSPQMVCWIAALYLLIKITESKILTNKSVNNILLFGIVTGIGMLCKIHTIFLWFGLGLFVLIYNKAWLNHWVLYVSAGITVLFFVPVIWWNIQNNFITFLFHGKRVDVASGGLDIEGALTFIGGQVLYCNPIIFFVILYALWHRHYGIRQHQKKILLLVALPLIGLATAVSLFKNLLPHWTGPAYASLILLTASYFATKKIAESDSKRLVPLSIKFGLGFILVVVAAGIAVINYFPGTLGSKELIKKGDGDFTLDMFGWKKMAVSFDSIYHSTHSKNVAASNTLILSNKWFPAAHIDFYIGMPLGLQTIALGSIEDIHQYQWLNQQRGKLADSTDLYIIIPSNYFTDIAKMPIVKNSLPVSTDTIYQSRGGRQARRFYVYYFKKDKYNYNSAVGF
jgi:4-amino-4-deoxy-L-arabinose transferase-like glycosyltransferase